MVLSFGVASSNSFTKNHKFGEGFNNSELHFYSIFKFVVIVQVIDTHEKVLVAFHRIKWENLTATLDTIPRIIGALEKFIITIIEVVAFNVNLTLTKVRLNFSITFVSFFHIFCEESLLH